MFYSVIIPVYNRPDEVNELLVSLTKQHFTNFEVLVVEDGSTVPCEEIVNKFRGSLDIKYFFKPNSGPGQTRNFGAERSKGDYLIILDSDCIIPEGYFDAVEAELKKDHADAFGGPDRADASFSDRQKTQDLQNNMGYSEKWLFSTNRHFVMNQFVLSFMREIYFRIIF
jgi:glycosyltransferase involved in cell wall biosynthesis